ncbi:hypothetical protein N431DRAFT_443669 [Stipitochalara longipes BDJ]|nr:hypothetical protein N431DRAFT_443669 [Stipitochalara longipes BDJ]
MESTIFVRRKAQSHRRTPHHILRAVQSLARRTRHPPSGWNEVVDVELVEPPLSASKMCSKCQNIIDHWHEVEEQHFTKVEFEHHDNDAALALGVETGCALCNQFSSDPKPLKRGTRFEALPRTFEEAIKIARYLDFRYIWIDSLCIVQDDSDYWEPELALMSTVYGASALNTAASGASNPTEGCFFKRRDNWLCQFSARSKSGDQNYIACLTELEGLGLGRMPLFLRDWPLQERVLPHRTIHFTKTELFWECNQTRCCEIFPNGYPTEMTDILPINKRPLTMEYWLQLLEIYSRCALSLSRDKLVAISGIAKLLHQHIGQRCSPCFAKRPSAYRAPTWSWASLDGDIWPASEYFEDHERSSYVCVKHIEVNYVSIENPFGEVRDVNLQLICDYLFSGTLPWIPYGCGNVIVDTTVGSLRIHVNLDSVDDSSAKQPTNVYFLILQCDSGSTLSGDGLVLEKTPVKQGQYRRVGCFNFSILHTNSRYHTENGNAPPEDWDYFPEEWHYSEIYTDERGATRRVIEIV